MKIEFDDDCIHKREITLQDIRKDLEDLRDIWDYWRKQIDEHDPIKEKLNNVLCRALEQIAEIAAEKGFDDINELEIALKDYKSFSIIYKK